jgi:hypothetical protein
VALVVTPVVRTAPQDALARALEVLAAVPSAAAPPRVLQVLGSQEDGAGLEPGSVVVTPPGVGVRGAGAGPQAALARAATWDALLAAVGATPRA